MGSAENGGGQHPAPEGRKIGTPPPLWMFLRPSLTNKLSSFTSQASLAWAWAELGNKLN